VGRRVRRTDGEAGSLFQKASSRETFKVRKLLSGDEAEGGNHGKEIKALHWGYIRISLT
jgi:hypothetical protein